MEYPIGAHAQQVLDSYVAVGQQYLFYENCTATEHAAFFQRYMVGHLVDTARLLETWGCERALCCAGLFHCLYSTEAMTGANIPFTPLSLDRRDEVRSILGWRAEHLVYVFCALEKRTFLAHGAEQATFSVFDRFDQVDIPFSKQDYMDVLALVLADWLEPVVGKEARPHLEAHVKASYGKEFRRVSTFLPSKAAEDFRSVYGIE